MSTPPGPPPQYPPEPYGPPAWGPGGQPWGAPPPPRGVNPWTALGVIAALALVTIVGAVAWHTLRPKGSESSSAATNTPARATRSVTTSETPWVPPQNGLEKSLLTLPELVDILAPGGKPDLNKKQNPTLDRPVNPAEVDPEQCTSAVEAAAALVYPPGSYTSFGYGTIHDSPALGGSVTQAVVQFPSPEKAAAFRDQQKGLWERCANTRVKQARADHRIGALSTFADTLVLELPQQFSVEGLPVPIACQRALKVAADMVFDVETCAISRGVLSARAVADSLAAKVG